MLQLLVALGVTPDVIPSDYDSSLAPSMQASGSSCPGPTDVQVQLFVSKVHSVDEKVQTIKLE